MRVDASAAPGSVSPAASAAQAARQRPFSVALALACAGGKSAGGPPTGLASPVVSGAVALTQRRRGADEGQRKLSERRQEAEEDDGRRAAGQMRPGCADLRAPDAEPGASPLVSASAVERLVMEIGRMSGRPTLEMSFGRDLRIRLTQSPRGVELLLQPAPALRAAASAELPSLVAALRARGVMVASARMCAGRETTVSRPRAR